MKTAISETGPGIRALQVNCGRKPGWEEIEGAGERIVSTSEHFIGKVKVRHLRN